MAKILLIRFSSIGDIVLTSPVIRCLNKQLEDVEIHFITKKSFKPVLENNPWIDKLWLFDNNMKEISQKLKEEKYDHIIDLHNNLRSGILKRKLKVPSNSFGKINFQKWLIVNFKINRLPQKHIVDRYLETVSDLGVTNDGEGLSYFLSEKDRQLPAEIEKQIPEVFISLVIGAKHNTKKAPAEKLAEICDNIDMSILIVGGPDDREEAKKIIALSNNKNLVDLSGELGLNQSASLVERSAAVITHDTGLMHIAAAFGKKIFSIWGNTIPEFGMYPYKPGSPSEIFEIKGLSCRPCSKIGFARCPKKHFKCMNEQDAVKISKSVLSSIRDDS